MATLREKQIGALRQMLNLNEPESKSIAPEPVWKILIYDRYGQDIISPLLTVKELREMGVTLHVQLHSPRDPIPDVPAVYFCMPSTENLNRITQDLQKNVYDVYHLNFISPLSRQKLEDLAEAALQANAVANIHKVFDQYLNFITLEDDMFMLRHAQNSDSISYYAINRGEIKDTEMESITDAIVDGLFSVFATLGTVPIVRSPRGNAAEMVAEKLDKKLRENLRDARSNLFLMDTAQAGNFSFQRPLLIILDRDMDMATPLHHTWTYQALAHDVLDLALNRVEIEEVPSGDKASGARPKPRVYDLDNKDAFWASHKGSPFVTVAEAIQEELEHYRSSEEEVKRLKAATGLDTDSDVALTMMTDNTAKLTLAVNSLPQMLAKKRLIDMHTTIATAILNAIKSRHLDILFEYEEKILAGSTLDKPLIEILSDPKTGTPEDKLRLFLIYYICCDSLSEAEFDNYALVLQTAGCNLQPLYCIKRWKAFPKMAASPNQYAGGGTKTVSMFSKLVSKGSSFVMEGVKNLVVKRHNLPVTRIVDQLMESRGCDDYRYFDPKQLRTVDPVKNKAVTNEAIVFVVGGGNYIEYQNLVDYAKNKSGSGAGPGARRVIYGSTTLNNAKQFLKQLALLGEEAG